jgi:hypothetical protein
MATLPGRRVLAGDSTRCGFRAIIAPMQFTVTVDHDEKEGVWFVQASDVPGLNAEAASFDQLVEIISDRRLI